MTVYIASDHAGFDIKEKIKANYQEKFNLIDLGPENADRVDYPDFADKMAQQLKSNPEAKGILVCGSGQGVAMRANKHDHIRAGLCWSVEAAELARAHNDANVLCMGARLLPMGTMFEIIDRFFTTSFEGGRHTARVEKISKPTC